MTNNDTHTITFNSYGEEVTLTPEFARYPGGALAIWMREPATGESYAKLTVNMPGEVLAADEVLIKDWSENEAMALALIDAGWIEYTGREVQAGFSIAKVAHLTGPLLDAYSEVSI